VNSNPDALRYEGGPLAKPFPNALPALLYVSVDEDVENEILLEIAEEFSDEIYEEMESAFPNYIVSPGVWPKSEARFQRYMLRIFEAYPMDPLGRENELYSLLDTKYTEAIKMGLLPPPLSRPWNTLYRMPKIMLHFQKDIRELYLRFARKQQQAIAAPAPPQLGGGY
jgi:uncharacterized protein (DUF2236 family)